MAVLYAAGLRSPIWSRLEARSHPMYRSNSALNRRSLLTNSICPRLRLLSGGLILSCQWTRSSTIQVCQHRVPSPHLGLQSPSVILWTSLPHYYGVSIVNIAKPLTQPYNKDHQDIRTFMSEIASVFKGIAQLDSFFVIKFPTFCRLGRIRYL
jgi:hypothetical protein